MQFATQYEGSGERAIRLNGNPPLVALALITEAQGKRGSDDTMQTIMAGCLSKVDHSQTDHESEALKYYNSYISTQFTD